MSRSKHNKCENCIHYNVCQLAPVFLKAMGYDFKITEETNCSYYKDKSLFVELLCKYNSTVYEVKSLPRVPNYILELNVVGFRLGDFPSNKGHKRPQKLICYANGLLYHRDLDDIGKTVFLTKEEAEQKLKEMENVKWK